MTAAEQGADYVMFGEPDAAGVRPAFAAIEERVAWWAELFEAPCVGYAAAPEEVAPLARGRRRFCRARRLAMARRNENNRAARASDAASAPAGACRMTRACTPPLLLCCWRSPRRLLRKSRSCRGRLRRRSPPPPPPARRRLGLWRLSARLLSDRAQRGDQARAAKRSAAMTLLGELYAQGLGVPRDDAKAAQWYKLAAGHGDRARHVRARHVQLRGPRRRTQIRTKAPSCSTKPPSSAIRSPPTISACFISTAASFRRTSRTPRSCSRRPPTTAIRKRNTRSPRSIKKGAACPRITRKRRG